MYQSCTLQKTQILQKNPSAWEAVKEGWKTKLKGKKIITKHMICKAAWTHIPMAFKMLPILCSWGVGWSASDPSLLLWVPSAQWVVFKKKETIIILQF